MPGGPTSKFRRPAARCLCSRYSAKSVLSFGLEDVDDGHVHHVAGVFGELRGHDFGRALAFDENLLRDAQLLGDGQYEVVVFVALVDVHHDTVLAGFECFAQRRHPQAVGDDVVSPAQLAAADRVVGDVADAALAAGRAVDGVIVAEHQYAVFGQFQVKLHDVYAHADHRFDGRNRVFGVVAPVAAVRSDEDFPRGGVVDLGHDGFGAAGRSRRPGLFPAGGSRKSRCDDQQFVDFSVS